MKPGQNPPVEVWLERDFRAKGVRATKPDWAGWRPGTAPCSIEQVEANLGALAPTRRPRCEMAGWQTCGPECRCRVDHSILLWISVHAASKVVLSLFRVNRSSSLAGPEGGAQKGHRSARASAGSPGTEASPFGQLMARHHHPGLSLEWVILAPLPPHEDSNR